MLPTQNKLTLLERFGKHAKTKSEAKRVYNLVKDEPFMEMTMTQLLYIRGIGRKALILVMEVAADIAGK